MQTPLQDLAAIRFTSQLYCNYDNFYYMFTILGKLLKISIIL